MKVNPLHLDEIRQHVKQVAESSYVAARPGLTWRDRIGKPDETPALFDAEAATAGQTTLEDFLPEEE